MNLNPSKKAYVLKREVWYDAEIQIDHHEANYNEKGLLIFEKHNAQDIHSQRKIVYDADRIIEEYLSYSFYETDSEFYCKYEYFGESYKRFKYLKRYRNLFNVNTNIDAYINGEIDFWEDKNDLVELKEVNIKNGKPQLERIILFNDNGTSTIVKQWEYKEGELIKIIEEPQVRYSSIDPFSPYITDEKVITLYSNNLAIESQRYKNNTLSFVNKIQYNPDKTIQKKVLFEMHNREAFVFSVTEFSYDNEKRINYVKELRGLQGELYIVYEETHNYSHRTHIINRKRYPWDNYNETFESLGPKVYDEDVYKILEGDFILYTGDSSLDKKITEYDSNGNIIKEFTCFAQGGASVDESTFHEYIDDKVLDFSITISLYKLDYEDFIRASKKLVHKYYYW